MRSVKFLFAGILLTSLLLGCGSEDYDPNTFVRLQVEDQSYEVRNPSFMVTHLKDNLHLMSLIYAPLDAVPGATLQWQMDLESLEALSGQNLDLKSVSSTDLGPLAVFRLTKDIGALIQPHSEIQFKIDRIEEGVIEGSFSGKDFMYVSKTKQEAREVDITAQFSAKLEQK